MHSAVIGCFLIGGVLTLSAFGQFVGVDQLTSSQLEHARSIGAIATSVGSIPVSSTIAYRWQGIAYANSTGKLYGAP
jgi:hypothetical protein